MKILHLIPSWGLGGAEKVILELVSCPNSQNNCKIITYKKLDKVLKTNNLIILKSGKYRKYFKTLWFIMKNKPGIIHGHLSPAIPLMLFLRFFFCRISMIYTVHSEYKKPSGKFSQFLHKMFFSSKKLNVVCVSDFIFNSVNIHYNIRKHIIYNGITSQLQIEHNTLSKDVEQLKTTANTKVFLTIARIVPVKNLELLIKAFTLISQKYDIILLIIGNDPSKNQQELMKLKKIATQRVFFRETTENPSEYLALADAFCITSISEGMPLSVIDAFSANVPVLGVNTGGISEIISHNITGYLADNYTAESYSKLMEFFLNSSENDIRQIIINAKDTYLNCFTAQIMCEKYQKLYNDIY